MEKLKMPGLREPLITQSIEGECPLCRGWELVPRPTEKNPNAWGHCDCLIRKVKMQRFKRLMDMANITGMEEMTLESFKPSTALQKKALESISANYGGYYLFGPWGVGKTHLMTGTIHRALKMGMPSVLISVPSLLDEIRKAGRGGDKAEIEELAREIPYLCLDDVGKQKDSDWTEERLFMLIDERWKAHRAGKSETSFTSQFPLQLLGKKVDGAIISRITGMCKVLKLDGEDMRLKQ